MKCLKRLPLPRAAASSRADPFQYALSPVAPADQEATRAEVEVLLVVSLSGKTGSEAIKKMGGGLADRDVKSSTDTGSHEFRSRIVIFDNLEAESIP